jgi:Fe-S cluster biogenesis protein NfuA
MSAISEEQIQQVIDEMRPYIQSHGGDLELASLKDDIVYVRMVGACEHCAISIITLQQGIKRRIKELIPEVKDVVAV